jgi:hypothetical protein
MNCPHTIRPCELADTCAWRIPKPTFRAEACVNFMPRFTAGNGISCGSCRRVQEKSCRFTCFRREHVESVLAIRQELDKPERSPAMKIPDICPC